MLTARRYTAHVPGIFSGRGPIAESDIKLNAQGFNEGAYAKAGSGEIRFTRTSRHLYAIVLAWPEDSKVDIMSLGSESGTAPRKIRKVELLGYGKVPFRRDGDGLHLSIPADAPRSIAPVFRIS